MTHPSQLSVQRIVIVGAGGFGREVLQWARAAWPEAVMHVAGFLSADPHILAGHACPLPVIGDPATFEPQPGDGLLLAIGIPGVRRRVAERLLGRGARFLTLIHPTAVVVPTARIDTGAIVCPQAIVSDSAALGRFSAGSRSSITTHPWPTTRPLATSPCSRRMPRSRAGPAWATTHSSACTDQSARA